MPHDGPTEIPQVILADAGRAVAAAAAAGRQIDLLAGLDMICASDVELRRVAYLWDRRMPIGAVTLMPGEEGIGKSTVGVRLMADITRGRLPGEYYGTPRSVLVLAAEDGLGDVLVPRMQEAGADLSRVNIVRGRVALGESTREGIEVPETSKGSAPR